MTVTVEFRCKDDNVAKHQDQVFRALFEDHLSWTHPTDMPGLRQFMTECMLAEARFQEHYDYVEVPGREPGTLRRAVVTENGEPKLLIPEVTVHD